MDLELGGYVASDRWMTLIDYAVIRSKVKVTMEGGLNIMFYKHLLVICCTPNEWPFDLVSYVLALQTSIREAETICKPQLTSTDFCLAISLTW